MTKVFAKKVSQYCGIFLFPQLNCREFEAERCDKIRKSHFGNYTSVVKVKWYDPIFCSLSMTKVFAKTASQYCGICHLKFEAVRCDNIAKSRFWQFQHLQLWWCSHVCVLALSWIMKTMTFPYLHKIWRRLG